MTVLLSAGKAWWATTNTDLTEGRGGDKHIAYCEQQVTAKRIVHRKGVQGSDGYFSEIELYKIDGQIYGPIILEYPTPEDKAMQSRIEKRSEAILKAKRAGMTDDEIAALR